MNTLIIETNKDISHLSNFKTRAVAEHYVEITSPQQVLGLKELIENFPKYLIVGGGTNLLFAFENYPGLVIKNSLTGFLYDTDTKILEAGSAQSIWSIAEALERDFGQDLWHRFIGLPGTVGGAVVGNAGCFGLETSSNFLKAKVLDLDSGAIETISKAESQFNYRESIFKKSSQYFVIRAWFDLSQKIEKYSSDVDNIAFRHEVQPKGNSCGSFFQNPSKEFSAGKLIELVGLKGYVHKNAYFSDQHANFLMTQTDFGDSSDLLELITLAQTKVKESYKINLIPEVRIVHP